MKPEQDVEGREGTIRKELMKPLHWEEKTVRRRKEGANQNPWSSVSRAESQDDYFRKEILGRWIG